MNSVGWLGLDPIMQLGIVTPDLREAIRRDLGRRPEATWSGWTYGPDLLTWQRVNGRPARYKLTLAVSGTNPQLEFIEPGDADTSLARALAERGQALHHVGIIVEDYAAEGARLSALGIEELEAGGGHGLDDDGAFGYFDTVAACGVIVELIQPPARRPAPHRTFSSEGIRG